MNIRVKVPQAAGIRRSVEVQHGARGFGLMLRRGLHGSKNWVLELDENGEHRSVWSKAFRVFIVLIPVWVVLSAVTGGPERGGHSTSAFQAVVMAIVLTGVGLSVFSARERRLGREEPWAGLSVDEPENTDGDEGEAETAVEPSSERPTEILENPQVSKVGFERNDAIDGDENGESGEIAEIGIPSVPQAIPPEAETVAVSAPEALHFEDHGAPEQATSEGVVDHGVPQGRNTPLSTPEGAPTVLLEKATQEGDSSQVSADSEEDRDTVPQAVSEAPGNVVTESERNDSLDTATVSFRKASRAVFRETENAQVTAPDVPSRETIQGVLQVEFAERGPYPSKPDPVREDWWVVAPDVEPEDADEPAPEEPYDAVEQGLPDPAYDPWAGVDTSSSEGVQEEPETAVQPFPDVVQRYFASRVSIDVDEAEKEAAREAVRVWSLAEVNEGRRTQSEVARLLGVGKATVSRWVNAEQDAQMD